MSYRSDVRLAIVIIRSCSREVRHRDRRHRRERDEIECFSGGGVDDAEKDDGELGKNEKDEKEFKRPVVLKQRENCERFLRNGR